MIYCIVIIYLPSMEEAETNFIVSVIIIIVIIMISHGDDLVIICHHHRRNQHLVKIVLPLFDEFEQFDTF